MIANTIMVAARIVIKPLGDFRNCMDPPSRICLLPAMSPVKEAIGKKFSEQLDGNIRHANGLDPDQINGDEM